MHEYPILLGDQENPWIPDKVKKPIPGKSEVRVVFISNGPNEVTFCGVIEKGDPVLRPGMSKMIRPYVLCPI